MNTMRTFLLMGLLTVIFVIVGQMLGGQQGMITAFMFALLMNLGTYWFSDKIVLGMYRAQEIGPHDSPMLFRTVNRLSERAGIPSPRVYIIPEAAPNAFATGRNPDHSAVAVTQGILNLLSEQELEGVIAHELAHIKNRDILIGTIAATMAGAITMLARMAFFFGGGDDERPNPLAMLLMMIVAPIAALLIQMAVSRSREYVADETGAHIAGSPTGLANALRRMEQAAHAHPMDAQPATAHMFIVNPLKSGQSVMALFSTHPPTEERIRRLEEMARSAGRGFGYN
ncbi:MAG: zinc metalloprotease HtpX [Armatimonadetes bacterium]|nr:zinc metalloprotease HtpX [Armatimonadota bacterium]